MRQSLFSLCLGAASLGLASAGPAAPFTPRDGDNGLNQCLGEKNVPIVLINDERYDQLAKPFNLRLPYKPAVIVVPTTSQHISDAVVCAGKASVKVQAKSGGHSYASFSSGGKDGSMMIDLENFQDINVDQATGIAKVGGGVRLGNLADGIYNQGKRALPHGTCPGVGLGGHATHGGYGYTSRTWGLALDTIVGLDVVLADGSQKFASKDENPDLFWALRGAAESFGIVTTFHLQTQPAPESITFFQFQNFNGIYDSKDIFTKAFLHIQEASKNESIIDERIAFGMHVEPGANGLAFSLSGSFFGPIDEFNNKIKPELLRDVPTPQTQNVTTLSWIPYLIAFAGSDIKVPQHGYDLHDDFFAKSITVPEKNGLSSNAVGSFYDYVKNTQAPASWFVIINLYGGPKSAINAPGKDSQFAAYSDRDALWVLQNYGLTNADVPFINGINDAIIKAQTDTEFGAYLNYVDPSYTAQEAHKLYYSDEVYARLAELKTKVDPGQVFWNPQAIGVQ